MSCCVDFEHYFQVSARDGLSPIVVKKQDICHPLFSPSYLSIFIIIPLNPYRVGGGPHMFIYHMYDIYIYFDICEVYIYIKVDRFDICDIYIYIYIMVSPYMIFFVYLYIDHI